ncbi:MAG: glycosyltransferase family 4 protein [Candidatus Magasanikbacteria bacterium]|nr:glycosyltransferase family 4 protein [Candidatus Magasanikbacteria bacterium]MBT4071559.1 glycosyltransferase family 4 protein [Candidatus Magasanikbacteria bacterium]
MQKGVYTEDIENADLIIYNSYQSLTEVVRYRKKYPNKFFVHRLGPVFSYHRGQKWKLIDKLLVFFANHIADAVVFQSEWTKKEYIKLGFNLDIPYSVIYNAVDNKIFFSGNNKIFNKKKIRLIGTSWSKNRQKGFEYYKYLDKNLDWDRYEMTFVGNSPFLFSSINHISPVSSKELAYILKSHDIFIAPMSKDACSNSILEALSCGLPVVALDSGANRELVKESEMLFSDKEDFLRVITHVVNNYNRIQRNIVVPNILGVSTAYLDVIKKKKQVSFILLMLMSGILVILSFKSKK